MVKYLHIRTKEYNDISPFGGLTVAYTCTLTEIIFQIARCNTEDLFCYRTGRLIAEGRLKSKKIESIVIPLTHPITQCIVDWLSREFFSVSIVIHLDAKYRWVSDFEADDGVEVLANTECHSDLQFMDDNALINGEMRYDG